ncbi:hypothetical protein EXS61_01170 [Candidatus Parcubacteria bacterium]|nr:hypothetical protein [Candidatus Parcubacteria bacterium]
MKKQKGFIVPLLAVLVLLAVGGGVYVYKNKKVQAPVVSNTETPKDENLAWKKYSDTGISFEYPTILSVKKAGDTVTLSHSVDYKHRDTCDFKGDAPPLEKVTDFDVSFLIVNKSPKDYIQNNGWPDWNYVSKNPFTLGSWSGYKIESSIESCGEYIYYLTISPTKTLVITRALATEFSMIVADHQTYLKLPGIIPPSQEGEIFTKILSSLKVQQHINVEGQFVTESYTLMNEILSKLNIKNINFTDVSLKWLEVGVDTKVVYYGYSFTVFDQYSVLVSPFEEELKSRGFVEDSLNGGDGTFRWQHGYSKNNVVCTITHTPVSPIDNDELVGTKHINTVACADRK